LPPTPKAPNKPRVNSLKIVRPTCLTIVFSVAFSIIDFSGFDFDVFGVSVSTSSSLLFAFSS